jgi:hypothetical protein
MFVRTGPFYQAQQRKRSQTLAQFQPVRIDDVFKDSNSTYVVKDLVKYNGKTLVLVKCIGSGDINLIGRVGYKPMHYVMSKCWRSPTH